MGDLDDYVCSTLAASVTAVGPFHDYLMALADTLGMVANDDEWNDWVFFSISLFCR